MSRPREDAGGGEDGHQGQYGGFGAECSAEPPVGPVGEASGEPAAGKGADEESAQSR
jgi:hypothetical protein